MDYAETRRIEAKGQDAEHTDVLPGGVHHRAF